MSSATQFQTNLTVRNVERTARRMMRRLFACSLFLSLTAPPVMAQVRVDVRLEKTQYLAGEPIFVVVDVRNVGKEPIGYSSCGENIRLEIIGAKRRTPPNIFGCFSGGGIGSGIGCGGSSHPPLFPPGVTKTSRHLLTEYDLGPGQYQLTASGKAGVAVPGAQFDTRLSLQIVASTEGELKAAFAPLVSATNDPAQRYYSRAAIIDSAPPFLESLIAQFAPDDQFGTSAIEALGRIASTSSRASLRNLYRSSPEVRRAAIVLALAYIGHRDDAAFFSSVLQDEAVDQMTRGYAALGLGHIGGDRAVQYLERALLTVPEDVRSSIAGALGNTRSRRAVPLLIGMYGHNPSRTSVCAALETLTHRSWCEDGFPDPAGKRRKWLRWWKENGSKMPIFGLDNCPVHPVAPEGVPQPTAVELPAPSRPPAVTEIDPAVTTPKAILKVSGYAFGTYDLRRVLFRRAGVERAGVINGGFGPGFGPETDPDTYLQTIGVEVPADLTAGRWTFEIVVNGRESAPVFVDIVENADVELTGISPPRPHPSQMVFLHSRTPTARLGDHVQLIDARGRQWRLGAGVQFAGIVLALPDEVADGEASIRIGRDEHGVENLSEPLTFVVTSGPLPLTTSVVTYMKPVAPGQWTDLSEDWETEFEISHADRVDVEFRQGDFSAISRATGPDGVHVRVPSRLKPGPVALQTRTWIDRTASEWSAAAVFAVVERKVTPTIDYILDGQFRNYAWWADDPLAPPVINARPGDAFELHGHFPVANAGDLRVQLRGPRGTVVDLVRTDVERAVRVQLPPRLSSGDWRLVVGTKDRSIPAQEITTVRVK
jgi:HEAT repeat protein